MTASVAERALRSAPEDEHVQPQPLGGRRRQHPPWTRGTAIRSRPLERNGVAPMAMAEAKRRPCEAPAGCAMRAPRMVTRAGSVSAQNRCRTVVRVLTGECVGDLHPAARAPPRHSRRTELSPVPSHGCDSSGKYVEEVNRRTWGTRIANCQRLPARKPGAHAVENSAVLRPPRATASVHDACDALAIKVKVASRNRPGGREARRAPSRTCWRRTPL